MLPGAEVVNLAEYKLQRESEGQETISGKAHCLDCNHEWVAVVPVGVRWLECPSCGSGKGHLKFRVDRGEHDWVCNCGNDLFRISEEGAYCTLCGTVVRGIFSD